MMRWLPSILCAVIALASCQKNDPQLNDFPEQANPDIEFISSLGYDVSDIEKTDNGYLVEGDIWLTEEWLADAKQQPQTRLTKLSNLVSKEYQSKLYLDPNSINGLPSIFWNQPISTAIILWNGLAEKNCNINIANSESV